MINRFAADKRRERSGCGASARFRKAACTVDVPAGESVRIMRQLHEPSRNQLAGMTEVPQSQLSAIENGRIRLGVERAGIIANELMYTS